MSFAALRRISEGPLQLVLGVLIFKVLRFRFRPAFGVWLPLEMDTLEPDEVPAEFRERVERYLTQARDFVPLVWQRERKVIGLDGYTRLLLSRDGRMILIVIVMQQGHELKLSTALFSRHKGDAPYFTATATNAPGFDSEHVDYEVRRKASLPALLRAHQARISDIDVAMQLGKRVLEERAVMMADGYQFQVELGLLRPLTDDELVRLQKAQEA